MEMGKEGMEGTKNYMHFPIRNEKMEGTISYFHSVLQ
jgi:hypothetical protein